MEDRRQRILDKCVDDHSFLGLGEEEEKIALKAMDEYATFMCLELLEYMANNKTQCGIDRNGEMIFWYAGEWLTKEQLFENFL